VSGAPSQTDLYAAAFLARCDAVRAAGQPPIDEPGVLGLLPSTEHPVTRLLVIDDRAYAPLAQLLPDARTGTISVFANAPRCAELLHGLSAWEPEAMTALVHRNLRTVPAVPLTRRLRFRPVRRLPDDGPTGVPLEDAVVAAMLADPRIDDPPEAFVGYLRALPPATRLFAAVDGDGVVRATSGCGVFGTVASVMFVNTAPDWRGRGIGRAMTAAALAAAQEDGARHACLDATDAGLSIYLRLGFEAVTRATRFRANSRDRSFSRNAAAPAAPEPAAVVASRPRQRSTSAEDRYISRRTVRIPQGARGGH
jgi:ribosomal protein S18 acetylase RimI-like enzyme